MNTVQLIGRLTKDPEIRTTQSGNMIARFNLAVSRDRDAADFPAVIAFGKTAELIEKYCRKGKLVGVSGRIVTGSFEKDGRKIYTTDVVADRIEFLSRDEAPAAEQPQDIPEGFSQITDEDIPF